MKRIHYHRYGGPEEMRLEPYELPAPGKDEIVMQVKAASINPFDWKVRRHTVNRGRLDARLRLGRRNRTGLLIRRGSPARNLLRHVAMKFKRNKAILEVSDAISSCR